MANLYYASGNTDKKELEQRHYDFKYLKSEHDVDFNTLIRSQTNIVKVLDEISKATGSGNVLKLKVEAPKQGSFVLPYVFDFILPAGMFVIENKEYIATVWNTFKDLIELYKLLKGKKLPKHKNHNEANNQITININGSNNVFNADAIKIYQNNITANKALNNVVKTLSDDREVDGFEVRKSKKSVVKLERKDFTYLMQPNEYIQNVEVVEDTEKVRLYVKKLDVSPNRKTKFGFFYLGEQINVTISDKNFIKKLKDGEKLGNGDSLLVELKTTKKYNEEVGIHIITGREVQKVLKIDKTGKRGKNQVKLFEE